MVDLISALGSSAGYYASRSQSEPMQDKFAAFTYNGTYVGVQESLKDINTGVDLATQEYEGHGELRDYYPEASDGDAWGGTPHATGIQWIDHPTAFPEAGGCWVATGDSAIVAYSEHGRGWSSSRTRLSSASVWATTPNVTAFAWLGEENGSWAICAGQSGRAARTNDIADPNSWGDVTTALNNSGFGVNQVWCIAANRDDRDFLAVGQNAKVAISVNDGATWTDLSSNITSLDPTWTQTVTCVIWDGTRYIMGGEDGKLAYYTGGTSGTWTYQSINGSANWISGADIRAIKYNGNGTYVLAGSSGSQTQIAVSRSTDGGNTWTSQTVTISTTTSVMSNSIEYANGEWMIGLANGKMIRSADDGVTWSEVNLSTLPIEIDISSTPTIFDNRGISGIAAGGPGNSQRVIGVAEGGRWFSRYMQDEYSPGGLVWVKNRNTSNSDHYWYDTEREWGKTRHLTPHRTNPQEAQADNRLRVIDNKGFGVSCTGNDQPTNGNADDEYVAWTFKKSPGFFDIVTYTGTGSDQTIDHNLGVQPGLIISKVYSDTHFQQATVSALDPNQGSAYYHKLFIMGVDASSTNDSQTATDTTFNPNKLYGADGTGTCNTNNYDYVAYLFGNSPEDGIACGTFDTPSSGPVTLDLGFEPQFLLVRAVDAQGDWLIYDSQRGLSWEFHTEQPLTGGDETRRWTQSYFKILPDGITINNGLLIGSTKYVYMAVKASIDKIPTDVSQVFDLSTYTGDGQTGNDREVGEYNFSFDMQYLRKVTPDAQDTFANSNNLFLDRTRGLPTWQQIATGNVYAGASPRLNPSASNSGGGNDAIEDDNNGLTGYFSNKFGVHGNTGALNDNNAIYNSYVWKRAKGFFDIVTYEGNGSVGHTIPHNLGVVPELILTKDRDNGGSWAVGVPGLNNGLGYLKLGLSAADALGATSYSVWSNVTSTSYTLGADNITNSATGRFVSYLFASLDGISKIGTYVGDGTTSLSVDCGFNPRFVLTKPVQNFAGGGNWVLHDTLNGIYAGSEWNYAIDLINSRGATTDILDPITNGFSVGVVGGDVRTNESGATYIFYAIA